MSLFNDMLRDLEARGARLPSAALPVTKQTSPQRKVTGVIVALSALAVAGVLVLAWPAKQTDTAPVVARSKPSPTPANAAALQPERTPILEITTPTPALPPSTSVAAEATSTAATAAAARTTDEPLDTKPEPAVVPTPGQPAQPLAQATKPEPEPESEAKLSITPSPQNPPAPDLAQHLQTLARAQLQQGNAVAAATLLASAPPAISENPDYHALLGYAWQQAGQPAQAATVYQNLLALDPSKGAWWLGLALAEQASDHSAAARAAFERAQSSGDLETSVLRYVEQRIAALSSQSPSSPP